MKIKLILLVSILISFNSYGENKYYYYSNGQIESQGNQKDNKYYGKWTFWYENGQKSREENYKDDRLISETKYSYHENSQIIVLNPNFQVYRKYCRVNLR